MLHQKKTLVEVSAILLMAAAPKLAIILIADPVLAQSSPTPLPSSLPTSSLPNSTTRGTTTIDGSSSMTVVNEALKKRFEEKFPGTKVELAASGTDEALKALRKGDINLAAVGRPLTSQEEGLVAVPISREKIAIIVGPDNPFKGNLTFEQFAKIFRGEITNWSQVGGSSGQIRFIDRPNASDTRRALSSYKVFKVAKFATGADATQLPQDDTAAVVRELGKNGISYAVASQVLNQRNVRVLPMHKTLPDDPRYPYSQPRSYVHKATPDPGTLAFLGFVTSAAGQDAIQGAKAAEVGTASKAETAPSPSESTAATVSPSPTASASPDGVATATESRGGFPWWLWLLPLALLGGLLWWLLRRGHHEPVATSVAPEVGTNAPLGGAAATGAGAAAIGAAAIVGPPDSRIILVPRNCREAYAYWEVSGEQTALRQQGGRKLALRLYDVTDINIEHQTSHSVKQFDCNESEPDLHIPVAVDDRDYVAELGYVAADDRWLQVARSAHVRVPACTPARDVIQSGGAVAGGAVAKNNGISPVPAASTPPVADAVPEVTAPVVDAAPVADAIPGAMGLLGGAVLGGAVLGGAALEGAARRTFTTGDSPSQPLPSPALEESRSRIVLTPRNSKTAYAYWEVPQAEKDALRRQGGEKLKLRLYDVTDIDINRQTSLVVHQFDCDEQEPDRLVPIEVDNRDYVAELGYITSDSRWLQLARSSPVRVPARTSTADVIGAGGTVAGGAAALATEAVTRSLTTADSSETLSDRTSVDRSRLILTPRDNKTAYAYWEVPQAEKDAVKQQGGQRFMLRLYDATDINIDQQIPHSIQHFDCDEREQDREIPIAADDRDYIAELGYVTDDERWLPLTRSAPVRVPAHTSAVDVIGAGGGAALAAGAAVTTGAVTTEAVTTEAVTTEAVTTEAVTQSPTTDDAAELSARTLVGSSRITLTPRDDKTAYVYWEVPQADKDALRRQGGQKLMLRLYDVTGIDTQQAARVQQFDCDEREQERSIPIEVDNRDYVAELGYVTGDGRWLKLATSKPVRVLLSDSTRGVAKRLGALATGGAAFAAVAGATAQSFVTGDRLSVKNKDQVTTGSCAIKHLTVHSKNNCCLLSPEQVRRLQEETSVSKTLEPGTYIVRIKSGTFSYGPASGHQGEPFVLLWIYGGKFINKKTNVEVDATWSSLNGYAGTLSLDVLETATLCAFFFDTHVDDNEGEVTISVIQLPLS